MIAKDAAPLIDELVFSVHRNARRFADDEWQAALEGAGLDRLGAFSALGEFLLAGGVSPEQAALRYRYLSAEDRERFLADSVSAGRLRVDGHVYRASDATLELLRNAERLRRLSAAALWGDHGETATEVDALIRPVLEAARPSPLLECFADVPFPDAPEHRLFALLERLRYLRNDAHAAAWSAAGLSAADMVEITPIWNGDAPRGVESSLDSLRERGLVEGMELTDDGRRIRDSIEDETNRLSQPAFDALGDQGPRFLNLLQALPTA